MAEIVGTVLPGFEPVRDAFLTNMRSGAEIGAAVCVYHHGRKVVDLWGGTADPTVGRDWEQDTLQLVYSCTKSIPAACAHLLVQRGQLRLDAPVADYWPEFAAAGKERIPVRWLLSHQAGLPVLDQPMSTADVLAWEPVVAALAAQSPVWVPGSQHGYHSLTYGWLVGEVVRRVSGRSLGSFFAQEIAEPLGLDLWIGLPLAERPRVSRIVEPPAISADDIDLAALPEEIREALAPYLDPTSLVMRSVTVTTTPLDMNDPAVWAAEIPAVNGICTARALARFYAGLIGEVDGVRILDADTLAAATAEQANGIDRVLRTPTRPALGFGLPLPDMAWWSPAAFGFPGHGGSLGYADPATGIAFGYLMNRIEPAPADRRAASLVEALHVSLASTTR
ncbi:serine hydrolase domain-containing protein [Micromonospora sonneratiae]|uniref:Serine hydrolase domain-containing protein n=1 Tax=Micromonospora sonneratiae TaxID=1184706 RepID=A0ABW3Y643_9ACTN